HPALDIRLCLYLDVDAQFFLNVPQDAFAPNQGAQPRRENVEPFHHQPPQTAFLTFAMARANRFRRFFREVKKGKKEQKSQKRIFLLFLLLFALLLPLFYSVLNAWTGLIEAARRAGISPAIAAARTSVNIDPASTPASMPFTS